MSKWRGDSEKLVRALFELARYHAPSTVFLDEIDSIMGSRGGDGAGSEHEASRRMKTELLIQMDGMGGGSNHIGSQVFVMAASNLPWDLDSALLRRLEKRVCIPLPSEGAREAMLRKHLDGRAHVELDFAAMAAKTERYSGADIELVSREAAMRPVRRLVGKLQQLEYPEPPKAPKGVGGGSGGAAGGVSGRKAGVSSMYSPRGLSNTAVTQAEVDALLAQDPVSDSDFLAALAGTRPSSDGTLEEKYLAWQTEFGAV